jgi:hypothetical protein
MPARRFPPPWTVEDRAAAFAVCGANGQALAYVYFEDEPADDQQPSYSPKDEARRIAANNRQTAGAGAPEH